MTFLILYCVDDDGSFLILVILIVHFMQIKHMCDSKSQTIHMHYPFQSTGRLILHQNRWSFHVYIIPFNSCPGTTTGVNLCLCDLRQHDILRWYHVKKYRATRGNRSELPPVRKLPGCHVNTPYVS